MSAAAATMSFGFVSVTTAIGSAVFAAVAATSGCGSSAAGRPGADAGGDGAPALDRGPELPPPPFTIAALVAARIGSENSTGWPNVGRAVADVDWRAGPFARVALAIDLESSCFPFEKWASNRPPQGHNWPADCDAFDRNFNVFIEDPAGELAFPFEVIHAVTPFGGPLHLEVDLTDLANARPGGQRLRLELGGYSDPAGQVTGSNAGWTVSARIEVTPGAAPRRVLAALPLLLGQATAGQAAPEASWRVPAGTVAARLEYRTSGHGQGAQGPRCIGPAEEFCDRRHLIFVDGVMVDNVGPYRQDCAALCTLSHYGAADAGFDYCRENPCGDPASVRAPRANWCPGSMTAPFTWQELPMLVAPGDHTFAPRIADIAEGGSWQVSATYYAFGAEP
jgi:hypothetical protein